VAIQYGDTYIHCPLPFDDDLLHGVSSFGTTSIIHYSIHLADGDKAGQADSFGFIMSGSIVGQKIPPQSARYPGSVPNSRQAVSFDGVPLMPCA